jgi:hypothetical protein
VRHANGGGTPQCARIERRRASGETECAPSSTEGWLIHYTAVSPVVTNGRSSWPPRSPWMDGWMESGPLQAPPILQPASRSSGVVSPPAFLRETALEFPTRAVERAMQLRRVLEMARWLFIAPLRPLLAGWLAAPNSGFCACRQTSCQLVVHELASSKDRRCAVGWKQEQERVCVVHLRSLAV